MMCDSAPGVRDKMNFGRRCIAAAAMAVTACVWVESALAHDFTVRSAAVDQPRVNVAFALPSDPLNPLVGEGLDPLDPLSGSINTIQVQAFYDTGASGIVLSESTANALGIGTQSYEGQDVVFGDVSPGGIIDFSVSEEVLVRVAPSLGFLDNEEPYASQLTQPSGFTTIYEPATAGPVRAQVGPIGGSVSPFLGDLNVVGVPAMQNKIVVMDTRPTNNFVTLLDDDDTNDNFDAFMRTHVYDASGPLTGSGTVADPGVPETEISVRLSYADFSRFTTLTPSEAAPPTLEENPFIGPNPLLAIDGGDPSDQPPPMTMDLGDKRTQGSWLLDTGAAASFISTDQAGNLGVSYSDENPLGSSNPTLELDGVPIEDQFTLAISGISGETIQVAGFYADRLTMPTEAADPSDPDDPNNLHFNGAPVLVFDIEVEDPETGESMTLDGILGMNYFTATADILQSPGDIIPLLLNPTDAPFDWVVFDEPGQRLRLSMAEAIPEPGMAGFALLAGAALLRRRK